MSTPVIRGTAELVFQGYTRRYNKQSGHQVGYIYEGTTDAAATAYTANTASSSTTDDADLELDGTNNTARLTLWYAGTSSDSVDQQETFDTWELVHNIDTKSIYAHPTVLGFTDTQIAEIKAAVAAREQDSTAVIPAFTGNHKVVFDHAIAGYDGYQVAQYILRRTTTVSALYSGSINFSDTFKLLTTAEVIAAENAVGNGIPTGIQADMAAIDANLPTLGTGNIAAYFEWRWLKQPPTRTQTGINKFNLTYEYWHAAWSTFLYFEKTPV